MKKTVSHNEQLQQWLHAVITHPAGVAAGVSSPAAQTALDSSAEELIQPSKTLTASERLQIYHSAYHSRLLGCLSAEYPCLRDAIGETVFDHFALAYLQAHPSSSFTLFKLSEKFPAFLDANRPPDEVAGDGPDQWPQFMIDLAQLERSQNEIYNGPGSEGKALMSPQQFLSIPPFQLATHPFQLVPCLQLHTFQFPVHDYFIDFHAEKEPAIPTPQITYLAISRINYQVRFFELTAAQMDFLGALQAGRSYGEALDSMAKQSVKTQSAARAEVRGWMMDWTDKLFFLAAE